MIRKIRPLMWAVLGGAALLLACGGGGGTSSGNNSTGNPAPVAPSADMTVLMMGNSHTTMNALPEQLAAMLRAAQPGKSVAVTEAPGWMFLEERVTDGATMQLLRGRAWSVVVLQAQKYSTSGQFNYSTAEAEELIRIARAAGSLPVLFPEWPRRGVAETERIYDLHVSIARKEAACVAPVGQAWDLAAQRHPGLALHAEDGNHSTPAGAYLAALVLHATVTGTSPLALADQANGVDATAQRQLRQVAADTVQATPARQYCPPGR